MFVPQEEMKKEFHETTLPARLEKFDALFKGPFFMGDKVRHEIMYFQAKKHIMQPKGEGEGEGIPI